MLSTELETRISQIIEKLNKICIKDKLPFNENIPKESLKYEYRIQKNAQRRMSQITNKVTDFFFLDEQGKKTEFNSNKEKPNESNKITPTISIALNMKRLINIGEFQIELNKLLDILEFSLDEKNKNELNNYLEKYVTDMIYMSDDNDLKKMNNDIKIKKFGETLEKKYHKILKLLKGYIKENLIVNNMIEKEKKNNNDMTHMTKKGKRRSLFDNIPLINEKENKILKDFPNFGNSFLSEMKEDIKKNKRYSCVNIAKVDKEKNISDEENSDSNDDIEDKNDENNNVYRPGKLRSSLCFENLFVC